jgi:hypothetical protein
MKAIVSKKLQPTREFFTRVVNRRLDARLANTLLKMCGVPKAHYLCSVVNPTVMAPFYDELDALVVDSFATIHGIPTAHVRNHLQQCLFTPFYEAGPKLYRETLTAIGLAHHVPSPLQEDSNLAVGPEASLNPCMASHRRSQEGNHAKTWMMYALPQYSMSTEDYCLATQLRVEHSKAPTSHCTCGFALRHGGIEALSHLLTCTDNLVGYNVRHEEIVTSLTKVLKEFGFSVQREPRQFNGPNDEKRPDLTIFLSRVSIVLDVTVVTNTASSWNTRSDPAAAVAQQKRNKHSDNVSAQGAYEFYPVACEASGHVDPSFDTMLRALSNELPIGTAKHFRRSMCFALSVAMQRGNARILKHAYRRLHEAATFGTLRWF